jgi:hypothetical protein
VTLLLSVITHHFVMQASDRRVIRVTDAGEVTASDQENKAIFVAERMTFAYTGHAEVADEDTAEFFQGVLARSLGEGRSVEEALGLVGKMFAGYLRGLPDEIDRHHAFVGVGWEGESPDAGTPLIMCASNAINEDGDWQDEPRTEFETYQRTLAPEEPFSLFPAGVQMNDEDLSRLHAQLGYLTDGSREPEPVGRTLVEAIREQAGKNDAVGSGVMVNCLPRSPGPPGGDIMFIGGPPQLDVRTFTDVPASTVLAYEYLGPLVATSDGGRMGDFAATGAGVEGTTGFSYRPSSAPPPRRAAVGQRVRQYDIGRNAPCWCGSGKKYKKCHGA